MQTYWDFTKKERAAMTREEVQKWLDAELMVKGVAKVVAPKLDEVPKVESPAKITRYRIKAKNTSYWNTYDVSNFVFEKIEDARAFAEMYPQHLEESGGKKYIRPLEEISIEPIECITHADYLSIKSSIDAAEEIKRRNDQLTSAYNKASKEMNDCLKGVWDDWGCCRDEQDEHRSLLNLLADYKKIAGDDAVATKFLLKIRTPEQIKAAHEWFDMPVPEMPDEKAGA